MQNIPRETDREYLSDNWQYWSNIYIVHTVVFAIMLACVYSQTQHITVDITQYIGRSNVLYQQLYAVFDCIHMSTILE
jgi:hypothetical protein